MQQIDRVVHARWIAPVRPAGGRLHNHAVAIDQGRIIDVLPSAEVESRYTPKSTLHRDHHLLVPGFVNAHTHAAMNLMRGIANDKPLKPWLTENIWPLESEQVSAAFVADGTDLAIAEMLRGGTTCFNDMYYFPDIAAERAVAAGIRASIGLIVIDFPTVWAAHADEYLDKGLAVHDQFKSQSRIQTMLAPHAPYTVSDAPLEKIRTYADELDLHIHMHVHETAGEISESLEQHGQRPFARLDTLGLVNPNLVAVHMTQLTDAEIARASECGIHVVHSPESNLKLASGLCPSQALKNAGVSLGLGTDGAASNNDLDMIGEMRSAALSGKVAADNAVAANADDILEMATLGGARALDLDSRTGSIEPGKAADLCAIDLERIETIPVYDPVAALVYSASREQVTDTWVDGQHLLADRRLTTLNEAEILFRAHGWQEKLAHYAR